MNNIYSLNFNKAPWMNLRYIDTRLVNACGLFTWKIHAFNLMGYFSYTNRD